VAEAEAEVQTQVQQQARTVLDFVVLVCKCKIAVVRMDGAGVAAAVSGMRQTRMDVVCFSSHGVDQDDVFADDRQRQDRMAGPA
jgi:hypothetical protein